MSEELSRQTRRQDPHPELSMSGLVEDFQWQQAPSGRIFSSLEKVGASTGTPVQVSGKGSAVETFHHGSESAKLVTHLEMSNTSGVYVKATDMGKGWWKSALEGAGYTLDKVHMIAPTVYEAVNSVNPLGASAFRNDKIVQELGVGSRPAQDVQAALAEAVKPHLGADYEIRFEKGGDNVPHQRICWKNDTAKAAMVEGGDMFTSAMRRVTENHTQILSAMRQRLT